MHSQASKSVDMLPSGPAKRAGSARSRKWAAHGSMTNPAMRHHSGAQELVSSRGHGRRAHGSAGVAFPGDSPEEGIVLSLSSGSDDGVTGEPPAKRTRSQSAATARPVPTGGRHSTELTPPADQRAGRLAKVETRSVSGPAAESMSTGTAASTGLQRQSGAVVRGSDSGGGGGGGKRGAAVVDSDSEPDGAEEVKSVSGGDDDPDFVTESQPGSPNSNPDPLSLVQAPTFRPWAGLCSQLACVHLQMRKSLTSLHVAKTIHASSCMTASRDQFYEQLAEDACGKTSIGHVTIEHMGILYAHCFHGHFSQLPGCCTSGVAKERLPRGHVRCPSCSVMLPESFINTHLDGCLARGRASAGAGSSSMPSGGGAAPSSGGSSRQQAMNGAADGGHGSRNGIGSAANAVFGSKRGSGSNGGGGPPLKVPPKLAFTLLSDKQLREMCRRYGLPATGKKEVLLSCFTQLLPMPRVSAMRRCIPPKFFARVSNDIISSSLCYAPESYGTSLHRLHAG